MGVRHPGSRRSPRRRRAYLAAEPNARGRAWASRIGFATGLQDRHLLAGAIGQGSNLGRSFPLAALAGNLATARRAANPACTRGNWRRSARRACPRTWRSSCSATAFDVGPAGHSSIRPFGGSTAVTSSSPSDNQHRASGGRPWGKPMLGSRPQACARTGDGCWSDATSPLVPERDIVPANRSPAIGPQRFSPQWKAKCDHCWRHDHSRRGR